MVGVAQAKLDSENKTLSRRMASAGGRSTIHFCVPLRLFSGRMPPSPVHTCPSELLPQAYTSPAEERASVCSAPTATSSMKTPERAGTCWGRLWFRARPSGRPISRSGTKESLDGATGRPCGDWGPAPARPRKISSGIQRLSAEDCSAGLTLPKSVDVSVLCQSH